MKMNDTISRQAAIDELEKDKDLLNYIISGMRQYDGAILKHFVAQRNQVCYDINAIERLPSAQQCKSREIIKCGECKYYVKTGMFCSYDGRIQKNSWHVYGFLCDENWFCADGERKTDV